MLLAEVYDEQTVEPLIKALKDRDRDVRIRAASALGYFKDPRVVEPLIHALKDKDQDVRDNAAMALSVIKDPRAIEPLVEALERNDLTEYAQHIIWYINKWGDPGFIEPLLELLDHEDIEVRKSIRWSLEDFPLLDVRVADKFVEQLSREKSCEVISYINDSLEKITGQEYPGKLEKAAEWWQQWWKQNREEFIKKWSAH